MIHLNQKQIEGSAQEMYGIWKYIVKTIDPTAKIKPWTKICSVNKSGWIEVAIWHLRKTGEIKERRT